MSADHPRKRPSAAVYRRRRLVLLIALVALVAVVWLLIAQPWRGASAEPEPTAGPTRSASATPSATTTPSGSATPSATADATAAPDAAPAAEPCNAKSITVEPQTDQDTYAPGQLPQLTIALTNTGTTDCTLNVGTSAQAFTIKSGEDVWWRSTDCQTEPSDMVVTLAAGQSVSSAAPLTWDRTRSSVGSCDDAQRQQAPGGGASYHLSVEIGGISSEQSTQFLLN